MINTTRVQTIRTCPCRLDIPLVYTLRETSALLRLHRRRYYEDATAETGEAAAIHHTAHGREYDVRTDAHARQRGMILVCTRTAARVIYSQ